MALKMPRPRDSAPCPTDYFGEQVAERYDESSADMFDPAVVDPAVDLLAELAGDGAALEFGIGTGRIALPLRFSHQDRRWVVGEGWLSCGDTPVMGKIHR